MTQRKGIAFMMVLVALAILAALMATLTAQVVMNRRALRQREQQVQALWFARAGIDIAAQKILKEAEYAGEELSLAPNARVRLRVERKEKLYTLVSEATLHDEHPVTREVQRRLRRVEGKELRLEVVP